MPAPSKVLHVLALLGKSEATYGTSVSLTTTDGILLQYADKNVGAPVTLDYAFDGSMGPSVASLAQSSRVAPSGRALRGDLPMRFRGPNGTYNATTLPSLHLPFLWSGLSASIASGSIVYTPVAGGTSYGSGTIEMYARGEKWVGSGIIMNPSFTLDGPAPALWSFATRGIAHALPTDTAAPAVTYPTLPVVPLASGSTFSFGSFTTAYVYSGGWDMGRDIDGGARVPINGGGQHLGFVPGARNPVLKVVIEAPASSVYDLYAIREAATKVSGLYRTAAGTTVGGSIALAGSAWQLIDIVPQNNGPTATVELSIGMSPTTDGGNDDFSITVA